MRRRAMAWVALALAPAVSACFPGPAPQRVATDDSRCSVSMPGAPGVDAFPVTLEGGLTLTQRSWVTGHVGAPETVPPRGGTARVLRRVTTLPGIATQGLPLLEMAGRRLVAELTAHRYSSPRVQPLASSAGPALEVRAGEPQRPTVLRLYAVPEGYCEVSIFGATSEDMVNAYFATAVIRP